MQNNSLGNITEPTGAAQIEAPPTVSSVLSNLGSPVPILQPVSSTSTTPPLSKDDTDPHNPKWARNAILFISFLLGAVLILSSIFVGSFFYTLASYGEHVKSSPTTALIAMTVLTKAAFGILAIYFGASALLTGAATAFYSSRSQNTGSGNVGGVSIAISTASPAVASVIAGAVIIVYVLQMQIKYSFNPNGNDQIVVSPGQGAGPLPPLTAAPPESKSPITK